MKKLLCVLSSALLLFPIVSFASEFKKIQATAKISSVTVYQDRAMVTRTANLQLTPGSYLVTFDKLPALIQDDSARVDGKGSAPVKITGFDIKRTFLDQSGEKRVKELNDEVLQFEKRRNLLDAKASGLGSQKTFYESIRVAWSDRISKEIAVGRPTSAELLDAAGLIGNGVTKAEEQLVELKLERVNINNKIDSLRRQLSESTASNRKEAKSVEVMLDVKRGGNFTISLSTITTNAGWTPGYDARLSEDAKTAELTFGAIVRQKTGEEWNNVDLTLSTARPSSANAPPELYPWNIGLINKRVEKKFTTRNKESQNYNGDEVDDEVLASAKAPVGYLADQAKLEPVEDATFDTAQIDSSQATIVFHIPILVDIPSDGTPHGTVVAIEQMPVNIEYLSIPKLSSAVFLKSELINKSSYPLLEGKINTFVGNTYTGSSYLKKVAAGEKFDLFFGSDDQVTVKRDELKQAKEAGVFSKNSVRYRYKVEINNFRKTPVRLTLCDQVPTAENEEIKVSLEDLSTKPDQIKADGTLTWTKELQAGEKQELNYSILVEYPKEREIKGL